VIVGGGAPGARRAGPADVAALVHLRGVMLEATTGPSAPDAPWRAAAAAWFTDHLGRPEAFAAFVVEEPGAGVVAVALGSCQPRPPGPGALSGLSGRVFNVATDPGWRRRGHARSCLVALLAWFERETPVSVVELGATPEAAGLYRSLGFTEAAHPTLRLRLAR
jgi:ribosomal protein S18 acetylase RimI-like enzyme